MSDYSHVPKALFSTGLDAIGLAYTKSNIPDPHGILRRRLTAECISACEALIVSPRVTFKVTGENAVLAELYSIFGPNAVAELLQEGAIEFVLWRGQIGLLQDEALIRQGVIPIAAIDVSTPEYSDPEASNAAAIRWMTNISESNAKRLVRLATERTTTTPLGAQNRAWEAVLTAHHDNNLAGYGIPADLPMSKTSRDQQKRLGAIAAHLYEAAVLVERELDLHESEDTWAVVKEIAAEVTSSRAVLETAREILRVENVPSVSALMWTMKLPPTEILRLRSHPATKAFQEWLWTRPDPANSKDVLEEYTALVRESLKGERNVILRAVTIAAISMGGFMLGDKADALVGGGLAGVVANATANIGLTYVDAFFEGIRERKSPRRFKGLLQDMTLFDRS